MNILNRHSYYNAHNVKNKKRPSNLMVCSNIPRRCLPIQPDQVCSASNACIPLNIFQTWHTKQLPQKMRYAVEITKQHNPSFRHYLYDDVECRQFIAQYFDEDILNAYDAIIPGAYKADLWRYCVLYKYGGIYLDIKYLPVNGFRFSHLITQEHWTLDVNERDIYNALIVSKPNNPILWNAIQQIVANVNTRYYGIGPLSPTGPELLGHFFTEHEKAQFKMRHILTGMKDADYNKTITLDNCVVLKCYSGYFSERTCFSKLKHYSEFWNEKAIYNEMVINRKNNDTPQNKDHLSVHENTT